MMELCSIASGSSGNCIYVGTDDVHLIIDAGISGKRIEQGLNKIGLKTGELHGILVTHEHADHIAGLGVVARRHGIPMYATGGTIAALKRCVSIGSIDWGLFHPVEADRAFCIGGVRIEPFGISHDAAEPVAYVLRQGSKSVGVVTDLGKYDDTLLAKLQGLDVLLLEANHDVHMLQAGRYPYSLKQRILSERGHLSNESSGKLLGRVLHDGFRAAVLGHLSKENNYASLAYETVRLEVTMGNCPYRGDDFPVYVAGRSEVSQAVCI